MKFEHFFCFVQTIVSTSFNRIHRNLHWIMEPLLPCMLSNLYRPWNNMVELSKGEVEKSAHVELEESQSNR